MQAVCRSATARRDVSRLSVASPPPIGRDALVGQPKTLRRLARLPEDIDGDAPSRVPITADPQPIGAQQVDKPLADADRAILVERAVVAEGTEEQLQRLRIRPANPVARNR